MSRPSARGRTRSILDRGVGKHNLVEREDVNVCGPPLHVFINVIATAKIIATSSPDEGAKLRQKLGVGVEVVLVEAGGTAEITQINARQKPIRLVDER